MSLTTRELDWINKRMDWYGIKFQEIFDEIADHIISAIEVERAAGDQRTIDNVFDKVTERDFGGYLGVDKIVTAYERAYRSRITKGLLENFKFYLKRPGVVAVMLFALVGFYLPRTKVTVLIMLSGLLLTAIIPLVYAYRNSPRITLDQGKQSIIESYMKTRALFLLTLINLILCLFGGAARTWDIVFLNPINYHPVIYMVLFVFFIIYGLSIIRLCRQEFKIAK
ncbi:hypothetical protein [Mucilaginibacter xinganensis]|uniref:Uncharacterized protein n=1 Tax=Mucilaginibacter xinganensis TaxID=1234841 RepID=A0A223NVN7_9SPHI|nr:hypothetical protein [Mucilaginibacter xinganensis]ASU33688.1 hypothetical protein MuYL_1792 [Mucilaginibacter xinganensis]